jgi:hypothetical protein
MIARSDRIRMRRRPAVASLLVRLAHAVAPAREAWSVRTLLARFLRRLARNLTR